MPRTKGVTETAPRKPGGGRKRITDQNEQNRPRSISVSVEDDDWFTEESNRTGRTKAEILRLLLKFYRESPNIF